MNDIKKDVIKNIIEAASACTRIFQIILFGSVKQSDDILLFIDFFQAMDTNDYTSAHIHLFCTAFSEIPIILYLYKVLNV